MSESESSGDIPAVKPFCPTVDQIVALGPCEAYPRERVQALVEQGWSVDTLCALPGVDAHWIVSRLMTNEQAQRWARQCALSVIHLWDAPEVVRQYLETGDESLRAAAGAAAWAAARDAEWDAAWDAAWAARDAACRRHLELGLAILDGAL